MGRERTSRRVSGRGRDCETTRASVNLESLSSPSLRCPRVVSWSFRLRPVDSSPTNCPGYPSGAPVSWPQRRSGRRWREPTWTGSGSRLARSGHRTKGVPEYQEDGGTLSWGHVRRTSRVGACRLRVRAAVWEQGGPKVAAVETDRCKSAPTSPDD